MADLTVWEPGEPFAEALLGGPRVGPRESRGIHKGIPDCGRHRAKALPPRRVGCPTETVQQLLGIITVDDRVEAGSEGQRFHHILLQSPGCNQLAVTSLTPPRRRRMNAEALPRVRLLSAMVSMYSGPRPRTREPGPSRS